MTRGKKSIEKRRRILKIISPISRGKRESDFLVSRFERRKRNSKKDSPLSRKERDFIFSRFKRRMRNEKCEINFRSGKFR